MTIFTVLFKHLSGTTLLAFLILFIFLLPANRVSAQLTTTCPNSDLGLGNFTDWNGCYGNFSYSVNPMTHDTTLNLAPCTTQGFAQIYPNPGRRHIIMRVPGVHDPYTNDSLLTIFPGESFSARLGDTSKGGHAEQLKYQITVNSANYLFIYRYAVVLESANHPANIQPGFEVAIESMTGTIIDSTCGYYLIDAPQCTNPPNCPTPGGWHYAHNVGYQNDGCYWKNWTTVGMDLTPYLGQTIQIVFTTHGCGATVHRGYAYISTYCNYLQIHTSLCEGDSTATLIAPPGFTYLWSTNQTTDTIVVPHPVTGATYSCTLTAANGCQVTITDTLTYTIIHANFTHGIGCATMPMQFTDSSYVNQNAVTGWHWNFGDGTSPVTGNPDPTHTYTTSGNFNVTLISFSTEGCSDTISKLIHVDSMPVITNAVLRQRICNNSNTNITLNSTVSNTLYTWTTTVSSPNITGYSNNPTVPGAFTNQTLTNSGNKLDSVIYHFTPHSSLCAGTVTNFTVVVCPEPLLSTTPLLKTICDSLNTNIVLTSNVDSTRFTWTCTANTGNHLSGYSDNTTLPGTLNINQVIYNSGFNIDTLHYHLTGHAYGCDGPIYDYKVIVKPFPDLSNTPVTETFCSGDSTNLTLTSHVPGTLFTWTCTPSGPGITGWANNAVPSVLLNQQLFNSTINPGTITYSITPHANNCDGHVFTYTVTVKPIPAVTNMINPSLCSGSTTNIVLQSNIIGTTFSWTATGSSPSVSGYSNSSGPLIAQTLINSGLTIETVLYSVTPAFNGCTGTSSGITVTVFPIPDVIFTPSSDKLCSAQTTNFNLTSHVAGATYTWTATGSSGNVNGFSPGTGNSIAQTLNNTGISIEHVTYIAQSTANSCPGTPSNAVATVNPVPVVTYTLCHDNLTTVAAQSINLKGGIPLGGNYAGAGVTAGVFNPSAAGVGNHTITYTYTNYLGCSRNATQVITVINVPAFTCGNNLNDIRDNQVYSTVKLGTRCWMSANLNFGTTISSTSEQTDNCVNEKYCYGDNAINCTTYGGLYQWDEMMRYNSTPAAQGFCPPGWHVPTENDWNSLFLLYISNGFAGSPLKYNGYSGFDAFLSGVRHNNVAWDFSNFAIMFWSSTTEAPTNAWAHGMNTYNPSVSYYPSSKTHAFAVRCIQD